MDSFNKFITKCNCLAIIKKFELNKRQYYCIDKTFLKFKELKKANFIVGLDFNQKSCINRYKQYMSTI